MKSEPLIGGFFVVFMIFAMIIFLNQPEPEPEPPDLRQEVESLRDDLNQLTVIVSELDEPVIVVDGQVVDEHFDWNEFHNVPTKK